MKKIIVEVAENSHRYHSLMKLLREDGYVFSVENNNTAFTKTRECPVCKSPLKYAPEIERDVCTKCNMI